MAAAASTLIKFLPAILGGLGALGGGRDRDTTTTTATSETNSIEELIRSITGQEDFTRTPTLGAEGEQLRDFLLNAVFNAPEVGLDPRFLDVQRQQQIQAANKRSLGLRDRLLNTLSQRGLTSSNPGALADIIAEQTRSQELGDIEANTAEQQFNLPLLLEELRRSRVNDATEVFRSLPVGLTGSSTTSENLNQTATGQSTTEAEETTRGPRGGVLGALGGFGIGAQAGGDIGGILGPLIGFNAGAATQKRVSGRK